jgi:outer membrane protein assembly factor BamB
VPTAEHRSIKANNTTILSKRHENDRKRIIHCFQIRFRSRSVRTINITFLIILNIIFLSGSVIAQEHSSRDRANWPMYGGNLKHTFVSGHTSITTKNLSLLEKIWSFPAGDAISASPTVVNDTLYVGSWDGYFYAIDVHSGSLVWKFRVDCQNTIIPIPLQCLAPGQTPPPRFFTNGGLITATAAVERGQVIFAAGKTVYSLNTKAGTLRWKKVICGNPEAPNCEADAQDPTQIFSSPAIFRGLIFLGHTAGKDGYRGAIEALDLQNGEVRWRFEVDPVLDGAGNPKLGPDGRVVGGVNRGCGAVWSSAAVDTVQHAVFFGTGDCDRGAAPPYHEALVALDAGTGRVLWAYRPRTDDTCDFDFGASPNIVDYQHQHYVGIGGKDGTYYLLKRRTDKPQGDLVWAKNVVFGGSSGGFFGASFDGSRILAATALGDGNIATQMGLCQPSNPRDTFLQEPSMHALDVATGAIDWEAQQNQSTAPTSVANDVVFSGLIGISGFGLNAYDIRTGQLLRQFPMPSSVNSAATPLGAMLFVTTGNSTDGTGSAVHAFALPAHE